MEDIVIDKNLVSFCGLYCGTYGKYKKEKCMGCQKNEKASWCKIRSCNIENGYLSCADCKEYSDPKECKKYSNFVASIFEIIFKSSRKAGIEMIKEIGYEDFAKYMAENNLVSLKR